MRQKLANSNYLINYAITWYPLSGDPPILIGFSHFNVILELVELTKNGTLGEPGISERLGVGRDFNPGSDAGSNTVSVADITAWPVRDLTWQVNVPLSDGIRSETRIKII